VRCYGLTALGVPPLKDFVEVSKALSRSSIGKGKTNQKSEMQVAFNVETNHALTSCMKIYESCG
ncbi:MAG: hypothetical protein WBO24_12610, partial [Nitrospirales bacterium]